MTNLMIFSPNDIDIDLAIRAHRGTSMTPERRGRRMVNDYVDHMQAVADEFAGYATADNEAEIAAALEAYRVKYIKLMTSYLHSHSNVTSSFIAGPSNFPVARNQKRSEWAHNHLNKWIDWSNAKLERLRKRYDPKALARREYVVRLGDHDAAEKMRRKIAKAEEHQTYMKAVNKVVKSRRKDYSDDEKVADLQAQFGMSETQARQLLAPDVFGGVGFPGYQLTNNGANIRRMKARLVELERLEASTAVERTIADGVTVDECPDDGRIRLRFPGKPSAEIRALLKRNGFRWSPRNGAWQRHLNSNGKTAVRDVTAALVAEYGAAVDVMGSSDA
jgi:hypothetical protein